MSTARRSLKAIPPTAWPGLRPPVLAHFGIFDIASPAAYDQRSASISGSYWSMRAPSDSRRRAASSVICWRTSSGSRMAETRAAISRSVRSESARRAISARDRCSSSMSRALAIAMAAWSASAASRSGVGVVEGVDPVRVRVDDAEDVVAVDQRRGQHRVDRRFADEGVAIGRVLEAAGPRGSRPSAPWPGSGSPDPRRRRRGRSRRCRGGRGWPPSAPGPAGSSQASAMPCPSIRSMVTPLAWSRRADASMTDWRISPWSRIALTRPAISRSVRSASAVRRAGPGSGRARR